MQACVYLLESRSGHVCAGLSLLRWQRNCEAERYSPCATYNALVAGFHELEAARRELDRVIQQSKAEDRADRLYAHVEAQLLLAPAKRARRWCGA